MFGVGSSHAPGEAISIMEMDSILGASDSVGDASISGSKLRMGAKWTHGRGAPSDFYDRISWLY